MTSTPLATGAHPAVGLPPTRATLADDLRVLGVRAGDVLLVHSSLRAVGWVCGGATAVVQALLDVLTPAGTLVVPTFTADNRDPSRWTEPAVPESWWPVIREQLPAFDPAISPSERMGAVAEQVRTWPGAVRSGHPQTSFAAVGPRAAAVTSGHELSCHLGEDSPLGRLEDLDARVLLLGVGWARCTTFHLGEYRQPRPPRREYSCVVEPDGARRWIAFEDVDLDESDFARLGAAFETEADPGGADPAQAVLRGRVGDADCRLFSLRQAARYARDWMAAHRR